MFLSPPSRHPRLQCVPNVFTLQPSLCISDTVAHGHSIYVDVVPTHSSMDILSRPQQNARGLHHTLRWLARRAVLARLQLHSRPKCAPACAHMVVGSTDKWWGLSRSVDCGREALGSFLPFKPRFVLITPLTTPRRADRPTLIKPLKTFPRFNS